MQLNGTVAVEEVHRAVREREQIHREGPGGQRQAATAEQRVGGRQLSQAGVQGAEDGAAGMVLGVDDAVPRVGPLAGEPELTVGIAVEGDLEVVDQQLAHHARAIFDHGVHRRRVRGVGAGGVDVGAQQVAVHLIEDDAPLRPQAVAGLQFLGAGDQGDVEAGAHRLQCVDRTRQAGADHQAVGPGRVHRRPR